jgi:hypothetical protein
MDSPPTATSYAAVGPDIVRTEKRPGYCEIHPNVRVQETGCWAWCCGAEEPYCEYCAMADYRKKENDMVKTPQPAKIGGPKLTRCRTDPKPKAKGQKSWG